MRQIKELKPYEKNPRKNDSAVDAVAESIKEFGFKNPIIIDKDGVIVAGHTRLKAAKKLGLEEVPTIMADDLSEEQVKAFRLADNKTAELAGWDFILLDSELKSLGEIDMSAFGFKMEEDNEYKEFVEKFEPKKTTDDCYTPPIVYDAIADWVAKEYDLKRENFVRPFYPGGDYQREKYKKSDVVVDNPPFSIMSEIVNFYIKKGIRFFLFAPSLTIFNYVNKCTAICLQAGVEYENGAIVATSFLTNLEDDDIATRSIPELYAAIDKANKENIKSKRREMPKYHYPDEVVTAAMMGRWSKYGVEQDFRRSESISIDALDAQKEAGKSIYGHGLLLAERAAAERAAAERWELSEREKAIVKNLGKDGKSEDMEKEN